VCSLLAWWVQSPTPSPAEPAGPPSPAAETAAAPSAPQAAVVVPPPAAPAGAVPAAIGGGAPAPAAPSAKPTAAPAGARPAAPAPSAGGASPAAPVAAAPVPATLAAAPTVSVAPPPAAPRSSFSTDGNYAVQFEAGGAVYAPGQPLAPGDYDITADFGDGRKGAGHATVAEGVSLVVRCQPGGGRCVAR